MDFLYWWINSNKILTNNQDRLLKGNWNFFTRWKYKIRLQNFLATLCYILSDCCIKNHFLFEKLSLSSCSTFHTYQVENFISHKWYLLSVHEKKMNSNSILINFSIFCILFYFTLANESENCEHIQLHLNDLQSQKTSNYNFTKQHLPFNGRPLYYSLK